VDRNLTGLSQRVGYDTRVVAAVAAVTLFVVAIRLVSWSSVFPGGDVVLTGNDPWFYRYWVDQSLMSGWGDSGPIVSGITGGEPLLVAALALVSGLLGGLSAVGGVMAWYPVVSAALTGVLLYLAGTRVTGDRRIALASVAFLAVTPGHALRTSLGFADHHAFDFIFLAILATSLIYLVTREESANIWSVGLLTGGLTLGMAGQVLAWDNGPLLLGALAFAIPAQVLVDVRRDRSPLRVLGPALVGMALAAIITWVVYTMWAWQSVSVSLTPALLFAGSSGVVLAGELTHRLDRSVRELALVGGLVGAASLAGAAVFVPDLLGELLRGVERITTTGSAIAEMQSLISGATMGSFAILGFLLVVALPAMVWVTFNLWYAVSGTAQWAIPLVFGWYFLVLSLFQIRFVGEFAFFGALFSGFAFVWLVAKIDVTDATARFHRSSFDWAPGVPSRRTVVAVTLLFVLVGGAGAMQSGVKIDQLTVDDGTYQSAKFMENYADENGWEGSERDYVFSQRDSNRLYNYFVNGDSQSYGYADNNYFEFVQATTPGEWYRQLSGNADFIVTTDRFEGGWATMQNRLHEELGSANRQQDGLARYRAVFVSDDQRTSVFTLVPGARLEGSGSPNATVNAETTVDLPGRTFTYERRDETNSTGEFAFRVAHPGTYTISGATGETTIEVTRDDVLGGLNVTVDS
jgi:dolichyl-diphosphooligosaccharide--protein glycosyltransferase